MPTLLQRPPKAKTVRAAARPVVVAPASSFRLALPWLLGSLVATMATLVGQVPLWTLLTFGMCVAWRMLADRWHKALPSLLVRLAVFVPMALGIVLTFNARIDATSMLAFLVALMSLKILELRSARDMTVVSLLGFFMTLSAFFFNQSLALFGFLLLALLANIVSLVRCHGAVEGRSPWPSVRLGSGMVLQSLPLVVLMFIIFPRVQAGFLFRLSNPNTGVTGMSDHLQPGMFGSLVQSDDIAFRAQINGGVTLGQNQLYWRAVVLEIGDTAMSWRASEPLPLPPRQTLPGKTEDRVEQRITIMPHGERWLFALDCPVELASGSGFRTQIYSNNVIRSQSPVYSKTIYTVISDLVAYPTVPFTPERRRYYTRVPANVGERSLALARSFRRPGAKDEEVVRAALTYLGNEGFTYSLTPGALPAENALDHFLFRSKKGFCEHYAAAFASLMRAAGVPSRIVVGYQGGEFNTWGKYYTIRQSDAHAWAEVWLEGRGWQREDPTAVIAPDRVSYGAQGYAVLSEDGALAGSSRLERLRKLNAPNSLRWLGHNVLLAWDSLDQQWNQAVLGFDTEQQLNFLQRFNLADLDILGGTVLTLVSVFAVLGIGMAGMRFPDARAGGRPPRPGTGDLRAVLPTAGAGGRRRAAGKRGTARLRAQGGHGVARPGSGDSPGHGSVRRVSLRGKCRSAVRPAGLHPGGKEVPADGPACRLSFADRRQPQESFGRHRVFAYGDFLP